MNFQEIIVGILLLLALAYLVFYMVKQTKAHDCSDCSLMDMKKAGKIEKAKRKN